MSNNAAKKAAAFPQNDFISTAAEAAHLASLSRDFIEECHSILDAIFRLADSDTNIKAIRALAKVGCQLSDERYQHCAYELELIERNLSEAEGRRK